MLSHPVDQTVMVRCPAVPERLGKSGTEWSAVPPRCDVCMHPKDPVDQGLGNNLSGAADGFEPAVRQNRNPVGKLCGLVQVMQ